MSNPRRQSYRLRSGARRRGRGQSLVELALVAPILVVMLLGAAQVGSIAFGLVSIDTAAREGARAGAASPNCSLLTGFTAGCATGTSWYGGGVTSHQCNAGDFNANPICEAVLDSAGTLSAGLFTNSPCSSSQQACVTITVIPPNGLLSARSRPLTAHLDGSSCNGANATITGVVSGMPGGQTATVTATTGETQPTDTSGNFSICVRANGSTTTQTLTAQVGSAMCGGYSGSVGPFPVSGGAAITENITVTAEGACPTPTPTPTPTPGSCNNQQATVTGVVSLASGGLPSGKLATITATTGETATTDSLGNYTICVKSNGGTNTQSLIAQIGSPVCGGYTGSVGPFPVTNGGTNTENITITAEAACPTPTPGTGPGVTCAPEAIPNLDTYFIQVNVTYPSPIFVPFIGGIFQSQPGFRVISTTVTDAIEPCTLTQGN